jgi:anti-sigma B factor antagonist
VTAPGGAPGPARPVVVTFPAEIDLANAGQLGDELASASASGAMRVIADLTPSRFCDSAGIGMLFRAHRYALAHGAELRLVVPDGAVLRVMEITGMGRLLPIYPSLDEAMTNRTVLPECE